MTDENNKNNFFFFDDIIILFYVVHKETFIWTIFQLRHDIGWTICN